MRCALHAASILTHSRKSFKVKSRVWVGAARAGVRGIVTMKHVGLNVAEIIDPETLRALPEGEVGEVVFAAPSREARPLIRLRTRDLWSLTSAPCACGPPSARPPA